MALDKLSYLIIRLQTIEKMITDLEQSFDRETLSSLPLERQIDFYFRMADYHKSFLDYSSTVLNQYKDAMLETNELILLDLFRRLKPKQQDILLVKLSHAVSF